MHMQLQIVTLVPKISSTLYIFLFLNDDYRPNTCEKSDSIQTTCVQMAKQITLYAPVVDIGIIAVCVMIMPSR